MNPRPLRTYITFAAVPSTVTWARRLTLEKISAWGVGMVADDVAIIVSELMTNAVRALGVTDTHDETAPPTVRYTELSRGQCVRLRVTLERDMMTIEVWDPTDKVPTVKTPDLCDEHGRGLPIVQALSAACGWYWIAGPNGEGEGTRGKVVWAKVQVGES